jgi:hypothetical protein
MLQEIKTMRTARTRRNRFYQAGALLLAATLYVLPISTFASSPKPIYTPRVTFDRAWIDYGVTQGGKLGMTIHTKFTLYELKGVDTQVRIKFQDSQGNDLKDNNKSFYTENGNVAVFGDLKPGYDPAEYSDFQIFMPYSEFDITRAGKYNLKMDIDLIYENGTLIQHMSFYDFEYSRNEPATSGTTPVSTTGSVTATFDSVWIDYNVTEKGELGMRIHTKFSVNNMKGKDGSLRIYFQKADGTSLKSSDGNYESKLGNVAAFTDIKPGYDVTDYKDLATFMPYSEMHLGPGKYNLKLDVDVIDDDGELIKHLTFFEFSYTKNN